MRSLFELVEVMHTAVGLCGVVSYSLPGEGTENDRGIVYE